MVYGWGSACAGLGAGPCGFPWVVVGRSVGQSQKQDNINTRTARGTSPPVISGRLARPQTVAGDYRMTPFWIKILRKPDSLQIKTKENGLLDLRFAPTTQVRALRIQPRASTVPLSFLKHSHGHSRTKDHTNTHTHTYTRTHPAPNNPGATPLPASTCL